SDHAIKLMSVVPERLCCTTVHPVVPLTVSFATTVSPPELARMAPQMKTSVPAETVTPVIDRLCPDVDCVTGVFRLVGVPHAIASSPYLGLRLMRDKREIERERNRVARDD